MPSDSLFKSPIKHSYKLRARELEFLRANSERVPIPDEPLFIRENIYYQRGIHGTHSDMFIRSALLIRLRDAAKALPSDLSFFIFDSFRSYETQKALFYQIQNEVSRNNPHLTGDRLTLETQKFVAHPDDKTRFEVLPHNSGGAIDVALCSRNSRKLLEFGCDFDEPSERSSTAFFERKFDVKQGISKMKWNKARENRRLLFNALTHVGFTNYEHEWWHFDLGNCIWSTAIGAPWVFNSMDINAESESL